MSNSPEINKIEICRVGKNAYGFVQDGKLTPRSKLRTPYDIDWESSQKKYLNSTSYRNLRIIQMFCGLKNHKVIKTTLVVTQFLAGVFVKITLSISIYISVIVLKQYLSKFVVEIIFFVNHNETLNDFYITFCKLLGQPTAQEREVFENAKKEGLFHFFMMNVWKICQTTGIPYILNLTIGSIFRAIIPNSPTVSNTRGQYIRDEEGNLIWRAVTITNN